MVGRRLVVSGDRRDERTVGRRLREFRYGSFKRAFRLTPHVTAGSVSASYDAGVLSVRVTGAYAETPGQRIVITTSEPVALEATPAEEASPEARALGRSPARRHSGPGSSRVHRLARGGFQFAVNFLAFSPAPSVPGALGN